MGRAGRPQGDPRGATAEANALAGFLRELTEGVGVRELAQRYEGVGKTLWGEYRSGARIIPLNRLNAVVKDRYRDARGRQVMLARARELHEAALRAEAPGGPAGVRAGPPAEGPRTGGEGAVAKGPAQERDAFPAGVPSAGQAEENRPDGLGPYGSSSPAAAGASDTARAAQGPPDASARKGFARARRTRVTASAHAPAADGPPSAEPGSPYATPSSRHPARVTVAAAALLALVATATAGGMYIAGTQNDAADRRGGPEMSLNPPSTSAVPGGGLGLPPTASPGEPGGGSLSPRPTTRQPSATASSPGRAPAAVSEVPGTAYAISPDRTEVLRWTHTRGWTRVGGIADHVYAGAAGVFATNPHTGDIYAYHAASGSWQWIGSPGARFVVQGRSLYALTPSKHAVMRWTGTGGEWEAVGGPADELYAGGAGLYATGPDGGDLFRYAGPHAGWRRAGGPGAEFAVGDGYVAALAPDRGEIWMADAEGRGRHRVGGPAGHIYAGGAGLFATDPAGRQLLKYGGSPGTWIRIGDAGTAHAVDDRSVYRIAKGTSAVERWTGGTTWKPLGADAGVITAG
ncbi:hypothetical protein [Streptomyces sp. NPDC047725]|uniref:hypothetical protein n=1 Tax=Streptomyces sp. NPDC047725 TaxID=3365487 RepID=UPI0037236B57